MSDIPMDEFLRDRLEALRSLNEAKIRAYARKYGAVFPSMDIPEVFWGGVHKARVLLPGLIEEERELSREWLRGHGLKVPASPDDLTTRFYRL